MPRSLRQIACILVSVGMLGWASLASGNSVVVDRVTLNSPIPGTASTTRVNFRQGYAATPLVFVLVGDNNPDPSSLRVTNITTTGFDVVSYEPTGEDGPTNSEQIGYIAITPGTHTLSDGTVVEAGTLSVSSYQGRFVAGNSWQTLNFVTGFANTPALLLQTQGNNNGTLTPGTIAVPWMTSVSRNVSPTSAQVALERSETSTGNVTVPETMAYLAIDNSAAGTFTDNGGQAIAYQAVRTSDSITGWGTCATTGFATTLANPVVVANKSTRDGGDGGWLRRCSLSTSSVGFLVDEDRANDTDRAHTTEIASALAFSGPFDDLLVTGAWEAGNATVSSTNGATVAFTNVSFATPMTGVPLIFSQPTQPGAEPASIRVRNVTANGFQVAAVEPSGSGGAHESMVLDYIAMVPGSYELPDGSLFEAGFVDTSVVQGAGNVPGVKGWVNVTFVQPYTASPTFLAQVQSMANEPGADPSNPSVPWLTVAVASLSSASVSIALDRSEAAPGAVTFSERIGYLAFTADRHGTFLDALGSVITYDSRLAASAVRGYDDGCFAVPYTGPFAAVPLVIGHGTTRNGNNGGWLRRCGISNSTHSQHWDEDQSFDTERNHILEDVAQLAFSQSFAWLYEADINLDYTLLAVDDAISVTNPKSIPGAVMELTVQATNEGAAGTDADSVSLIVPVQTDTELFVGDLDGSGNPVIFVDGSAPHQSGLTWGGAGHISYSNDNGSTYTYTPPLSAEYDANVTHMRVAPSGKFTGVGPGSTPEFSVRYRVRIR